MKARISHPAVRHPRHPQPTRREASTTRSDRSSTHARFARSSSASASRVAARYRTKIYVIFPMQHGLSSARYHSSRRYSSCLPRDCRAKATLAPRFRRLHPRVHQAHRARPAAALAVDREDQPEVRAPAFRQSPKWVSHVSATSLSDDAAPRHKYAPLSLAIFFAAKGSVLRCGENSPATRTRCSLPVLCSSEMPPSSYWVHRRGDTPAFTDDRGNLTRTFRRRKRILALFSAGRTHSTIQT